MTAQGYIQEVSITRVGDELDVDAALGATTFIVTDTSPFIQDDGNPIDQIEVEIEEPVVLAVTSVNPPTREITVLVGADTELMAGTQIYAYPASLEKWAMTEISGREEPVLALVGGDVYDKITDGVRDPEDQEGVILEIQNGDWTIINLVGEEPVQSGEFLDPETVPTNPEVAGEIDEIRSDITNNTGQLETILGTDTEQGRLENVEETATQARNLANTADGRVSMSDYEPAPEDAQYYATDRDGNLILDEAGQPILLDRNEGSIWFTRTRDRVNECTNPSFENSLNRWSTSELVMERVDHAAAPAGGKVARLTNSTAVGNHTFTWDDGGAPRMAARPGLTYTWSMFAEAVSGTNTGVVAQLEFFDAAGASLGLFGGTPVDLIVDDWTQLGGSVRPNVTAVAPDLSATVVGRLVHPHSSAVWQADGGLMEMSAILGRYFDGSLYDCSWGEDGTGVAHDSQSHMHGGKVLKVFELDDGAWIEKVFTGDTLVDIDATNITHGQMDGELLADRSVPQDRLAAMPCTATEELLLGDLVNVYSVNGSFRARKALAVPGREAHGFVLETASPGSTAYIYSSGYNPFMSGLEPGTMYLSTTTAGAATPRPSAAAGTLVQRVGVGIGPSVLNFMQNTPIRIVG